MPTQEPRHFWPGDRMPIKPARPVEPDTTKLPGQTVVPFEISDGRNRDFLFETTFFETNDTDPKAAATPPTASPEITRLSLGE